MAAIDGEGFLRGSWLEMGSVYQLFPHCRKMVGGEASKTFVITTHLMANNSKELLENSLKADTAFEDIPIMFVFCEICILSEHSC